MKKPLIFVMLFAILLALDVLGAATITDVATHVTVNTSNSGTTEIANTGNATNNFTLTVTNLTSNGNILDNSNIAFSENPVINLTNGTSRNITVNVTVPVNQTEGTYTGTITADGAASTLTVVVTTADHQLLLTPNPLTASGAPGDNFTATFTVKNVGTETLTSLKARSTELEDYNLTFAPNGVFNLASGETKTVNVSGRLPQNVNAKEKNNPHTAIIFINNSNKQGSLNLDVTAESMLNFDDIVIDYNGESEDLENGENVQEIRPGDKITISGEVHNLFDASPEIQIEEVKITIIIEDLDDGNDIEEEDRVKDIDSDDNENFEIKFDVPGNAEDDKYRMTIEAEGKDENGARHNIIWVIGFEVDRLPYMIKITKATLSKTEIECGNTVDLAVRIENIGRNEEDEVELAVKSTSLGINERIKNIYIDNRPGDPDSKYSKTFTFDVGEDVKAGTYGIDITTYYKNTRLSDSERVNLVVKSCATATTTTSTIATTSTSTTITFPTITTTTIKGQTPGPAVTQRPGEIEWLGGGVDEKTLLNVLLLGAGLVALIIVLLYLLVVLFK